MKIDVLTQGGLGNQLFQARYAHFLSEIHPNSQIRLVNHNVKTDREFVLNDFFKGCSHVELVSDFDKSIELTVRIARSMSRRFPKRSSRFMKAAGIVNAVNAYEGIQSNDFAERSNQKSLGRLKVIGHFQNSALIKQNRCFDSLLDSFISRNTSRTSKVSRGVMHIRLGDYFHNYDMGPLASDYFISALENLVEKNDDFVVHSDGIFDLSNYPKWLKVNQTIGISSNPFDVLYDASYSSIFIGSNSSLSWWASYVQEMRGEHGLSVLPDQWMRGIATRDLPLARDSWVLQKSIWA